MPGRIGRTTALRADFLEQIDRLQATKPPPAAGEREIGEYLANSSEPFPAPRTQPVEARLEPALEDLFFLDPATIARELGIGDHRSSAELDQARRNFALRYHPDRVAEEQRERAKLRMQIANMLIDEAKRGQR